ncbi:MAG: hypothetical protein K1000chlam2_01845, partial [Chlamydiae bacterium]|nr:hypothetical protein [Chlamydiota bacterium]
MLNFRKLKQDFSSSIVKEGKGLYDDEKVVSAKILHLDHKTIRIAGRVVGQYENTYESEIEIDRQECEAIDSDCDCPYNYDCHHLTALLFYLEQHIDKILVSFSKDNDLSEIADDQEMNKEAQAEIIEQVKEAQIKADQKQEQLNQEQVLQEYVSSSHLLATSPFFWMQEKKEVDRAEVALIFNLPTSRGEKGDAPVEIQLALRLPFRSKPLYVPNIKEYLQALRYEEPIVMGGRRYCFSLESFDPMISSAMRIIRDQAVFSNQPTTEKAHRIAYLDREVLGRILAELHEKAAKKWASSSFSDEELPPLPGVYLGAFDTPLRFALQPAELRFNLEYMKPPISKILLEPLINVNGKVIELEEALSLECAQPGMIFDAVFYRFQPYITRLHLRHLKKIRDLTIPEPLFGTFVENALPEFEKHAQVCNQHSIEHFVTMPFVGAVQASCELSYLNGELDAKLFFHYDKFK